MLNRIDAALAGAIDFIADDVSATVKSVREQGMMRTLGDAVEDAGSMVASAGKSVLTGTDNAPKVTNNSGMNSSYADVMGGGRGTTAGAAFPYVPQGGAAFPYQPSPSAAQSKAKGGFAPGIGIQRASPGAFNGQVGASPGAFNGNIGPSPGAFNGQLPRAPGPSPGAFRPQVGGGMQLPGGGAIPGYLGPSAPMPPKAPPAAPQVSSFANTASQSYASTALASGSKEATLDQNMLNAIVDKFKADDVANRTCFDCGAADTEWASVSFGIFLCITCGGYHRQLGTHISRVRSTKMDTWSLKQLTIFEHGSNARLKKFFDVNQVPASGGLARYSTPAATWYRESWMKNKMFGRDVPAPTDGVRVGPCVASGSSTAPKSTESTAPPADLLDLGGGGAEEKKKKPEAASTDLLGVSDAPALLEIDRVPQKPSAGADLLGFDAVASSKTETKLGSEDLLALQAMMEAPAQTSTATMLSGLDLSSNAQTNAASVPTTGATFGTAPAATTLAGGAKLVQPVKEEKAEDPFAMALEKWGM
mmetsp:Transcript_23342/g.53802  ORF Transcript_23342/g.53802 Transcript_23342/m.53802 type:complete len:533 (-) Transcript_23342:52-1650(-)